MIGRRRATPTRRRSRSTGDSFAAGKVDPGGVFPTKGKGAGIAGEAAFPDLLSNWDRKAQWQQWRRGVQLAFSEQSAQVTLLQVQVLARPAFTPDNAFISQSTLVLQFPSETSPDGVWSVTVRPRGQEISPTLPSGQSEEFFYNPYNNTKTRVMRVEGVGAWGTGSGVAATSLIGELIEDTVGKSGRLLAPDEGHALMVLSVDTKNNYLLCDATRQWRYQQQDNGAYLLRELPIGPDDPLPVFGNGRRLTQSMTLSCSCPAQQGAQFFRLGRDLRIGVQGAFPQQGGQYPPSGKDSDSGDTPEGVSRIFRDIEWMRDPGVECKHCVAARWLLRAPTTEPTDMPSPAAGNWGKGELVEQMETVDPMLARGRLEMHNEKTLLDATAWSNLSVTLVAAAAGDAYTVMPTPQQVRPFVPLFTTDSRLLLMHKNVEDEQGRFNEMHWSPDPTTEDRALRGDWWVGRGLERAVYPYESSHVVSDVPAISIPRHSDAMSFAGFP